ncbi:MAG TPA: CoA transferase [Rhizomicrobium sp.]|jgi:crotonobetainyl-CoA:carnitine CoA-transferase CaiB-like acyl-CoA transferase|nr:CoA transferase [Rhizomicrobium sp.]
MPDKKGPLDGVRVLDLTEFIFGPYATQTLGDFGAEVIKIENPGGDRQRHGSKHAKSEDMSALYMTMNRNKRSVVLDLKSDDGRGKLRALIPTANVFIHNVRADAMARLGFSYDEVAKLNPHIVYVHCVGYGSDGPYAGRQAFDDLVQAASGTADLLPRVDGNEDMRLLPSFIADKVSSMHALSATLAALYHQKATGEGQFVEVPMFECFTHFMLIEHLYGETFEPPVSHMGHTPALAADRRPLKCKDGHICIQPVSRASSAKFMELGGIPNAYESERFLSAPKGSRVGVYYAMQREAAMAHTVEEWMKLGEENRIPIMRANGLDEVLDDPHLKAVGFFETREHPTEGGWRTMRPPVKFSKTPASIRLAPPKPGQDNDTVLAK